SLPRDFKTLACPRLSLLLLSDLERRTAPLCRLVFVFELDLHSRLLLSDFETVYRAAVLTRVRNRHHPSSLVSLSVTHTVVIPAQRLTRHTCG
ncbi:hypothetical protein BC827DRAFT_1352957, partial [Russula dissimulans]